MPHASSSLTRITRTVERWFADHQRPLPWRDTYDPYLVWVSEVMAQQTRLEVVVGYFERFVRRFPDVASLAAAAEDEVTALWSGLGYYRRARMLRQGAADVMARFGGRVPDDVGELRSIPGIGRYTAGAIASIAYQRRAPIVDGNVARILARLEGEEKPWEQAARLVEACHSPRDFNQGLMELGALVCRHRSPLCAECPVRTECVALATGRIQELPSPRETRLARVLRIDLFVVTDGAGQVLLRREGGPLMRGLFHLPHGNDTLLPGTPLPVIRGASAGTFRHSVTNRRISFEVFEASLAGTIADREGGEELVWVPVDELRRIPHPSYVTKALRLVRNRSAGSGVAREK